MGALLIFIIRTKFYMVLGKLRKQNNERNNNRIRMGCELEKPNPASFGSTAVRTDSGTTAMHTFSSIHDAHNGNRVEIRVEQARSKHKPVLVGIFFIHFSLYLAEVTFKEH